MTEEKNLEGLSGWLIVVGFGLIFSTFRIIVTIFPPYLDIFSSGSWEILTTPGTEAYNPLWAPFLIGEILINSLFVLTWVFITFLFFTKKKTFPVWYIGAAIFTMVFIVIDAFAIKLVLPNEPVWDPETVKEFSSSVISVIIWVPYMIKSQRVKATFVN